MIPCPFKGKGRDSLPCEATPELRRASHCPDCIAQFFKDKVRSIASPEASESKRETKA